MPDYQFMPQIGANKKALTIKTLLDTGKVRLFKSSLSPSPFTTKAQLVAAECDFDGYPAGGITLTAWTGPINRPGGGAVLTSPLANFAFATPSDPPVTNNVGGWWVEDADEDVFLIGVFSPPRQMAQVGDGIVYVAQDVEGVNLPLPSA